MEKIDELTNKIYHEGVEKGKAEAQRIIEDAQAEAQRIIAEAQNKAQELAAEAEKKAAELDKNTKSELKLYTDQAVNALKSEITTLISDKGRRIICFRFGLMFGYDRITCSTIPSSLL